MPLYGYARVSTLDQGQETRTEKTNVTVDTLTEFYARYPDLPSRF
jgi:DNA invertase Pin-like site-specific DNA recombinase